MKKLAFIVAFVLLGGYVHAQVGVGTLEPNASSQLEIAASDRGVLIPRIALTSPTDGTVITNGTVESLLVYNTTDNAQLDPGYYYWYKDSWKRLVNSDDVNNLSVPANTVIFEGDTNTFTYVDENGTEQTINLDQIVKANESVTTLTDNADGTYLYVSENKTETLVKGVMPKFFYMPSITFNVSEVGTGFTKDLHKEYVNQFTNNGNSALIRSTGAPLDIPNVPSASDIYYYVTYYDATVFGNVSINENGILTYDVISNSVTPASFMNIVLVIK